MKTLIVAVCVCCACRNAQAAKFQLSGDVYEVLYRRLVENKVGSFGPFSFDSRKPQGLRTIVEKFVEAARRTTAPARPVLTFSLAQARNRGIANVVMFQMYGGGKQTRMLPIDLLDLQT